MLARREHSRVELTHKLTKKGFSSDQVDRALDQLQAADLQSDQRFIEDFVRSRVLRGNGPLRISQELRNRGVESDNFLQWVEEPIDWLQIAMNTYQKKYGVSEAEDMREQAKRMRYMQSKGFSSDIIRQILK